ncbi:MAG: autotransporter domain-containing protein, partial [Pseudomonadota bacterium]|nr:autotransporter domain-containing protein [Pseudomonadota bacterium]
TDDPDSHSVLDVIGKTTFSENTAGVNGGAIMNWVDSSQENATSVINIIGEVNFDNNTAGENGGAIFNGGTLDLTGAESTFVGNSAGNDGGAIYNEGTLDIEDAEFVVNSAKRYGGGIANYSKLVLNNVDFEKNNAYVGGAMFLASGSDTIISNSVFDNNTADYGGAVYTATGIKNVNVSDSKFTNNSAKGTGAFGLFNKGTLTNVLFENNKSTDATSSAGALFLGSLAQAQLDSVQFVKNTSASAGGAIATRIAENEDGTKNRNDGTLDIVDGTFVKNTAATDGGAIYNTFYTSVNATGGVYVAQSSFVDNNATNGGAIYNDGTKDVNGNGGAMNLSVVDFSGNAASNFGGAVYNAGTLDVADAKFGENNAYVGGAMFLATGSDTTISNSVFDNNTADYGGAVYTATGIKNVNVSDSKFTNNSAKGTGAFGLFNKGTLTNVLFENNKSTDATSSAGALFLGSLAQAQLDSVQFVKNTSASAGGAIATRVAQNEGGSKNRNDGMLDIIDSTFVKNTAATDGGAIYNTFYTSVEAAGGAYVAKSSFVGNKATNGGAIYNDGTEDYNGKHAVLNLSDLTFADNIASDKGGAIFNGADAVINMSGTNAFTNNTANKGANDIYNAGTLNITGGETTIGGGILGNGTLTLAEGAVLNVGNATIRQDNLDIDGIVKVSVLSDRSYGRLIAAKDLDVADTAELHLSLGSVGEYDMFGGQDAGFSTIKYGDTYIVTELDGGIIKVETKSVEQLAQDTGLTTQAAGVVAGLANSHDSTLQKVSLAAQQALNAGDKALVEQEAKKLNPEEKPVVQALASAVQNQVLSLASGRMSGGAVIGRAGGDSSQENGFWMHGLFNKSKLDGQFHGYTRGVAFGMDTVIDNKYILGGGLAFNNSDVHSNGRGHTDIDSKTLFLYGQYKPNNWFANMTLTYNMAEYDETKSVFGYNINNVYDVDSYGAQIMGGYDFNTGITTEAGLRYLHIDQDAYADISATKTDFLTSVAGIKYAFAIENDWAIELRPELRAALTYDIISEADVATIDMPGVASYKVAGEKLDRLGGEFGIGLTADYKGLKVTLMYDLDLHKDYTSQTGMIKFRTQF